MPYIKTKNLKLLILPLLITLACLLLGWYKPTTATAPTTFAAKVTYVYDGDTLNVLDNQYNQHIIRLASIDAPEKDQPYGKEAGIILRNLVLNKPVIVSVLDTDNYGRKIARVYYENNKDASTTLLRCGAAWHYGHYDLDKPYFETHMNLENLARQEKLGLWADGKPTPPWLWRRKNKIDTTRAIHATDGSTYEFSLANIKKSQ